MAGAFVQSWEQSEVTNVTSTTVTVSGATANNLLIAAIAGRAGMDTIPTASGWTRIHGFSTGNDWGSAFFYKIANGSTDDFATDTWTDSGKTYSIVCEYSGLDSTSPLETDNEDETNIAGSVISQGTGSATPSTANGTAIAVHTADQNSIWNDPPGKTSVNNSFTIDKENDTDDGSIPYVGVSSLNYTSATAKSCTMDTTDSGNHAWGAIATFKEPASGTSPISGAITTSFSASASITAKGAIAGAASLAFSANAALSSIAAISGVASVAFTTSADLSAKGHISGAANVAFDTAADLSALGHIEGVAGLAFTSTATISDAGSSLAPISGTADLAFSAAASIAAVGHIEGAAPLAITATAILGDAGSPIAPIAGTAALALTAAATLSAKGHISGAAQLAFAATANLTVPGTWYATETIYIADDSRMHYTAKDARLHYTQ